MICVVSCLQTPINAPRCHEVRKNADCALSPVNWLLRVGFILFATSFYNSSLAWLLYIIVIYCCLYHFCAIYKLLVPDLREDKDYSKSTSSKYKF